MFKLQGMVFLPWALGGRSSSVVGEKLVGWALRIYETENISMWYWDWVMYFFSSKKICVILEEKGARLTLKSLLGHDSFSGFCWRRLYVQYMFKLQGMVFLPWALGGRSSSVVGEKLVGWALTIWDRKYQYAVLRLSNVFLLLKENLCDPRREGG